ncbi:MAG TPA: CPBP family intramembrane metalloprotease [Thermofilum sp.]|nr:CPBP family intramembrane metalloprotease [Thermofilum sp.]
MSTEGKHSVRSVTIFMVVSFALAYLLDWTLILGIISISLFQFIALLRMYMPFLGVIAALTAEGKPLKRELIRLGTRLGKLKYLACAVAVPYIIYAIGVAIGYVAGWKAANPIEEIIKTLNLPGASEIPLSDLNVALASLLLGSALSGVTINAAAAYGEEIGWRGLLLDELYPRLGRFSYVSIGIIWALWHAPLILFLGYNYPRNREIGLAIYAVVLVAWTGIMCELKFKSDSLYPPAAMHGTINALAGLMLYTFPDVDAIYKLPVGLASALSSYIVLAAYFAMQKLLGEKRNLKTEKSHEVQH